MQKRVLVLLLAVCFCAAFLLPIGYVLANVNHEHVCCSTVDDEKPATSVTYLCCVICLNVHDAKYSLATDSAYNSASAFSMQLCLFDSPTLVGQYCLHTGSSLVALKVRMDN